jgi:hypothetical protein
MYKAQRSTDEKIVDSDDESFIQPSNLRELLTHRDDVMYAARQNQTKTFNMRTWALSSRGVRSSATASVAGGVPGGNHDGMSQVSGLAPTTSASASSPQSKPAASTKKRAKQQQWLVDDEGAVEVDKPFFDYTFEHSSILEHRVDCPIRPTGSYALASIQSRKPGTAQNLMGSTFLEVQAEAKADESMLLIRDQREGADTLLSLTSTSGAGNDESAIRDIAENVKQGCTNEISVLDGGKNVCTHVRGAASTIPASLIMGKGPLLGASFKHPLERASSKLPPAFGAAYHNHLASVASRVERHREKLLFEAEQSVALQHGNQPGGDDLVTMYSSRGAQHIPLHYHQSASRPESPALGIKPSRSTNDFLYMAPASGISTPPTTSLSTSRPTSQMTAGGRPAHPLPLPEFYRLSSPETQTRRLSNVTIEPNPADQALDPNGSPSREIGGSPYRVQVGGGNAAALLSTSASSSVGSHKNDTSCLSNFSERAQRILQSKAGSRLRRYYGENMHMMRRMDRASNASFMMSQQENQLLLQQAYDEGADSTFQNSRHLSASQHNLRGQQGRGKSNSLVDGFSAVHGALTVSNGVLCGSFEELSPPVMAVPRRGQQLAVVGGGDYDWRCYQSTAKFMKPEVQRKALVSPCETQVPLYHPVAYSELFEEQRILSEQRDLHNIAYEDTKEIYRQQGAYIQVAMDAMAKGEFQKSYHVESSALRDIPELELTRMRLQRDTVPVMTVRHEGISTVTPVGLATQSQ